MSQLTSVALNTARTLLNDDGIQLWTDVALLPKLAQAHMELQAQLRAGACPVTRGTAVIAVAASTVLIDTLLPTNIVEPITLWEKANGEADGAYTRMTEYDPLPVVYPDTKLIWWKWDQEKILLIGATTDRVVRMYFKKMIPIPTIGTAPIGMIDGELYLGPRTAALAAGSTGNPELSAWCTAMAEKALADVLVANKGRSKATPRP